MTTENTCTKCLVLLLTYGITTTLSAPTSTTAPAAPHKQEKEIKHAAITDNIVTNIILQELLEKVEKEGATLKFSHKEKKWVLEKLSDYLFGSDEAEIVDSVLSKTSTDGAVLGRHKHRKGRKSNHRVRRETDNTMDRLSFSREYRILVKISELLRTETEVKVDNGPSDLINIMQSLGK